MSSIEKFPLICISGPPFERGKQYGRQAGKQIATGIDIYRDAFATAGIDWPAAMRLASNFTAKIAAYDMAFMQEIQGIAAGSEQSVEAIVALNARTEVIFWHDNEKQRQSTTAVNIQEGCTALAALPAVTADGHLLHAQNWDWNPRCEASSIVLKITSEEGPDILTFVEAGQLARHGMNSAGIGLTVNGLQCNLDCGHIGIPNPLIRRRLLSSPTLAGALGTVLNADISFSHNLMLSHKEGAVISLEATPEETFWLYPQEGIMSHANHFKCPVARTKLTDIGLLRCPESLYRDSRVREHLMAERGAINIATVKTALADTFGTPDAVLRMPKARPGGNISATVATEIMDTTAGSLWIAPSPYKDIRFTEYSL